MNQESVPTTCTNCENKQLQYLSKIKSKTDNSKIMVILMAIMTIIFIITLSATIVRLQELKEIKSSGAEAHIYEMTNYINKIVQAYTSLKICSSIMTGSGILFLIFLLVHILKPNKIETIIIAVCPKCGEIIDNEEANENSNSNMMLT